MIWIARIAVVLIFSITANGICNKVVLGELTEFGILLCSILLGCACIDVFTIEFRQDKD